MAIVRRFDSGTLGKVRRTPQGGIRVPAAVTKSGLFHYTNPDGSKRVEFRPEDEVFREDSMESLKSSPVTNLHPSEFLTSANFRHHAVGYSTDEVRRDGDVLVTELIIQDEHTISLVESESRREVSCGYTCELEHTPGKTPAGERYDAIQRNVCYNHIALVPKGRAGREVALRLDSDGNVLPDPQEPSKAKMKIEIIDGTEYEIGTPAHKDAVKRRDAADAKRDAETAQLLAEKEALQARVDGFEAEMGAKVAARVKLLDAAKAHRVDGAADMSDADIQKALLGKLLPGVDLADKSEDYVSAALDIALANGAGGSTADQVRQDVDDSRRQRQEREDEGGAPDLPPDEIARRKMIKASREQFRRPELNKG